MSEEENIAEQICLVIQNALPQAERNTNWNAPNFSIEGRDLITLNLSPRHPVRVVFHRGAKAVDTKTGQRLINDTSGLLTWASDQRAVASFPATELTVEMAKWLREVCLAWVTAVNDQ